nr:MAG TPA: HNH endonuclease [Bacteriophage sp.]
MQIHHIDKNKTNNKPENLIKLCLECHIKKHN